jgi:DNA-binding IclR family transcriptional regulator
MTSQIVKSARRVFEILEAFDRERRPLALKDVCSQFEYPASSAAVLLKSLVTLGYLDYDRATRTYFPTMRIALLGQWVPRALFGEGAILRLMEKLHRETGETVLLATQSDLQAQYVHALNTGEPLRAGVPAGTLRPLATSGTGWLLLSRRTEDEIEKLCRRIDIETGRKVDRTALKRNIAQAKRDGFVFSKHNVTRGSGIIAVLLPGGAYGRTYAIGVGGTVARLEKNQDAILKALRRGVARFAKAD